ncbi:MAG: sulfite exporter TauE/SafE [Planctomycetota bacterium]|jgi:sulfite exporter TauE/SafE
MPSLENIAPFFLLAFLGSLHCVGMCGGFALAASSGSKSAFHQPLQVSLYVIGKSLSYAILGTAAALLAHSTTQLRMEPEAIVSARTSFAWLAGITIILCGFASMGVRFPNAHGPIRRAIKWIEPVWNGILGLSPLTRSFGIGISTGLLPCGLSWSAIALGTQVDPPSAGLGMFVFGLGTAPALIGVSLAPLIAPIKLQKFARFMIGPALILLGISTIARGGLSIIGPKVLPDCCAPSQVEPSMHGHQSEE